MRASRALLYLASFVALGATAAFAFDRLGRPSIADALVWAVVVAAAAGAPALFVRRAWPVSLALLPLGALLVARTQMAPPADADGVTGWAAFYADQLASGAAAYVSHGFPIDLTTAGDLKLLLSLSLYGAVALAALFALVLRRPMPAVVVLAVPFVFGVTVDQQPRAVLLTFAFVAFACCLLLYARALRRRSWGAGDTATGLAGGAVAALLALWIVGSVSVAGSLPLWDWRTWDVSIGGDQRFVFDSMEGYAGLLDPENDERVMRVTSPVPAYWRANALHGFDGTAWFSGEVKRVDLESIRRGATHLYTVPPADLVPEGPLVRQSFEVQDMEIDYFFTGGAVETLALSREVPVRAADTFALAVERPLGPDLEYTITAVAPKLKPGDLVGRGRGYPQAVARRATLPFPTPGTSAATATEAAWRAAMGDVPEHAEWLPLYRLNQQVVGEATDPYEIALRVEEYLRLNYAYSLTPPSPKERSPYADFLFTSRQGFCQHFAGAMAVLLRFNGVPARVALGFDTGVKVGKDAYVVKRNDAHAWVEAYFPGVGWVAFEPTPGQDAAGSTTSSAGAGFRDPYATELDLDLGDTAVRERETPRGLQEAPLGAAAIAATLARDRGVTIRDWLPWALLGGAVFALVAWPAGRALLRRRRLRRGDPDARLRSAWALAYADLGDYGQRVPASQTLEETAAFVERRYGLDAGPLVARAQAVRFGGRAASADDAAAAATLRRELRRRLRAAAGVRRALLAAYGLGSRRRPPTNVPSGGRAGVPN